MNEKIDNNIPFELLHTQVWFGEIISRPLNKDQTILKTSPQGHSIEEESKQWICPSSQLKPHERIEIYNQQYWARLLKIIDGMFPSLVRFFGYELFHQKISIPYLYENPPQSWCLQLIGDQLPEWIKNNYTNPDKEFIVSLSEVDLAMNKAFNEKNIEWDIAPEQLPSILNMRLKLQPHVTLFSLNGDLFSLRKKVLERDVDYWQNHSFPEFPRNKPFRHILYRSIENKILLRGLSLAEHNFLNMLEKGQSIDEACGSVENDLSIYEEVENNLSHWIQTWFSEKIFVISSLSGSAQCGLKGYSCSVTSDLI